MWRSPILSKSPDGAPIYNDGYSLDQRCKQPPTMPVFKQRYTTYGQRCYAIWDPLHVFNCMVKLPIVLVKTVIFQKPAYF